MKICTRHCGEESVESQNKKEQIMATMNPMKPNAHQGNPADRHPAQDHGHSTVDKAKDAASDFGDKAKDMAKDAVHGVRDMAKDAAHNVRDFAKDAASTAEKKTDSAIHSVGAGMADLAGTIRDKGPHEGMLGNASSHIAKTLESGSQYLQEEGIASMAEDFTNIIRRNPIPALFVGIGLGFLLAQATRR